MANLTAVIADDVLKRARTRALDQGTSVNAVVRDHLERYADGAGRARAAMRRLLELAEKSEASSGPEGRTWTRASLYER